MVKFSKQFKAELVPEWKEAFVDYLQLKKDLKKIRLLNGLNPSNKKKQSPSSAAMRNIFSFGNYNRHHEAIQVHRRLASSASMGDIYETELLQQFKDIEAASEFFVRLDLQLNKVNQFYKVKEKEFLERGECLKKQMDILIELKAALTQQCDKGASSHDSKDDPSISCHILSEEEQNAGTEQTAEERGRQDMANDELEKDDMQCTDSTKSNEIVKSTRIKLGDSSSRSLSGLVFNCHGKNLGVNIPMKTPIRGFSAISFTIWEDLVHQSSKKCSLRGNDKFNVNKTTLHQAEKMINGAFIELYKGLGYLKTYRNLNMLAFSKILKKFEKVTNKQVLPIYLRVVESSYFNCSDKVIRLSDEIEEQFIKHFAKDDKKKAMRYLKPNRRNESHAASFFTGLFTGCFIVLLAGYIIMTHITSIYTKQIFNVFYMEIVYPVLRKATPSF
ncbi:hypothetical protein Nepgr_033058 [Nepenthes gracilis]|uniref:SPX domain-containing protein n=1 Tax=Nepenthes gracilis TaxID=150966 RepID=A0AAD3Y842_NEPGR|nr:hypothetical protein Nepgr_033058 [Nepenthes gracilis]